MEYPELIEKINETKESRDIFEEFKKNIEDILNERKKPLLVMFYSDPAGEIALEDVDTLEKVFDDYTKKIGRKIEDLDLLIQTNGGSANTSYRLIQLIRSYCSHLNVLVSTHANSGGTLITFGADIIEMGTTATLSPIDVQIVTEKGDLALLSIEKYIEFLEHSCRSAKISEDDNRAHFLTELTKELINEVGTLNLGDLFRLRGLTILHSKILLRGYMFKNHSKRDEVINRVISKFNQESPSHDFEMDFELVKNAGLNVIKMDNKIYKLSRSIINILTELENNGAICHFPEGIDNRRIPFFKIFG